LKRKVDKGKISRLFRRVASERERPDPRIGAGLAVAPDAERRR